MAENTTFVFSIFTFYIIVGTLMGLVGGSIAANKFDAQSATTQLGPPVPSTEAPGAWDIVASIWDSATYFIGGLAYSLSAIGIMWNALLFTPLIITLSYIIISLIRGSS